MKKIRKIIVLILIIGITLETGALISEGYTYKKYRYSSLNLNGKIICKIDDLINFSGMVK